LNTLVFARAFRRAAAHAALLAVRSGAINLIAMNTKRRPKSGSGALLATPAPASTALAPHSDTALPRFEATCTPSAPDARRASAAAPLFGGNAPAWHSPCTADREPSSCAPDVSFPGTAASGLDRCALIKLHDNVFTPGAAARSPRPGTSASSRSAGVTELPECLWLRYHEKAGIRRKA